MSLAHTCKGNVQYGARATEPDALHSVSHSDITVLAPAAVCEMAHSDQVNTRVITTESPIEINIFMTLGPYMHMLTQPKDMAMHAA